MTRVRLAVDCPWQQGYSSSDVRVAWAPGEVREVEERVASYLTSTFPGVFVVQRDAPPAAAEAAEAIPVPDPDPALKWPPKREPKPKRSR